MTTLLSLTPLLAQVGSGRITGGWGYVYASYAATLLTLVLYSVSLFFRLNGQKDRQP